MSASSVNLIVPMVAFPGRTSSSDAGSMLSLTQPTYQSSLNRSVPQAVAEPRSPVLPGLVDTALPFTPFFLPTFPTDLPLRTTSWLQSGSPKSDVSFSTGIRTSSLIHQEFFSHRKPVPRGSPPTECHGSSQPKNAKESVNIRESSPPPPQLSLGRLSIKDISGSANPRNSASSEQENFDPQPPILSPGILPSKSRRTSDSSTPCGLQIPQMNGPDRASMTGSGGTGTDNLNWLADVATAHSSRSSAASSSTTSSAGSGGGNIGGHGRSSASPTRGISLSHISSSGSEGTLVVTGSESSGISSSLSLHSSQGSLFRPPISLPTPSDLSAQRLYSSQYHPHPSQHPSSLHPTSSASGTNLSLYNQPSHIPPYASGYYPSQYGTSTYQLLPSPSEHTSPSSVSASGHRPQYFSSESYSAMLASVGSGHITQGAGSQSVSPSRPSPSQQPRPSAFHPASSSVQASQLPQTGSQPTAPSPTFTSTAAYIVNQSRIQSLPSRSSDGSPASRESSERSHSTSSHQRSPEIGWVDEHSHCIPKMEMSSRSAMGCKSPSAQSTIITFERSKQSPTSSMWAKAGTEVHSKHIAYRVPTGKEGSLKHRILRPSSISILEPPPSSVMVSAPLSAPPTQTVYHENIPSPKPFSSTAELRTSASPVQQFNRHRLMTHGAIQSGSSMMSSPSLVPAVPSPSSRPETPPPPPFCALPPQSPSVVNPTAQHLQYPVYYVKGSLIQLTSGQLKKVEDMTMQDFIDSTTLSDDLRMDSCTVVKIQEAQTPGSVLLYFSVGQRKVQVTAEAPVEHPFFVFHQGWSSYSPEQTMQRYGLSCQRLKVGDVCVSLTRKKPSTSPIPTSQSVPSSSLTCQAIARASPSPRLSSQSGHLHLQMTASLSPSRLPVVPEESITGPGATPVSHSGDDIGETAKQETTEQPGQGTSQRDWLQTLDFEKSRTDSLSQNQVPRKRKRHWSAPDQVSLETTPRTTSC